MTFKTLWDALWAGHGSDVVKAQTRLLAYMVSHKGEIDNLISAVEELKAVRAQMTAFQDKLLEENVKLQTVLHKRACKHENAEFDSGGAWCPDCGSRGTFPGNV